MAIKYNKHFNAIHDAKRELTDALAADFKAGDTLYHAKFGGCLACVVLIHGSNSIKVLNTSTGKAYWIGAEWIVDI